MGRCGAIWMRLLAFLCCVPVGSALLAKVYGVASMRLVICAVALPGIAALAALWRWARRAHIDVSRALAVGSAGGLLGTSAYDLARIPFVLAGQRVFVPISVYGLWISGAHASSDLTELVGWGYHVAAGTSFGIMYALVMARRHWAWAVLWGLTLETIVYLSPFSRIFHVSGNYPAIIAAYLGHVAYGVPLGLVVSRVDSAAAALASVTSTVWQLLLILVLGASGLTAVWGNTGSSLPRFDVQQHLLRPRIVRVDTGATVTIASSDPAFIEVDMDGSVVLLYVPGHAERGFRASKTGIHALAVHEVAKRHSSFLVVEPVEKKE